MVTIVLGQYENDRLIYKGHVSFGKSQDAYNQLLQVPVIESAPLPVPKGNESVTWIRPELVCVVQYMPRESAKMPQQSVFRGLRDDKAPQECIAP
jgi:ATP-dependent DNA ligase